MRSASGPSAKVFWYFNPYAVMPAAPHRGIEPGVRFFNLIGLISLRSTLPEIGARLTGGAALGDTSTAFGIFSRFQVTDFDLLGLFLLRHFIFLFCWVVLCQ